jgi:hypothetical protein
LQSIGHNLDGNAVGNDLGIGFAYNPAGQVVARSKTNGLYDYQTPPANQVYTSNGRNQIAQIVDRRAILTRSIFDAGLHPRTIGRRFASKSGDSRTIGNWVGAGPGGVTGG